MKIYSITCLVAIIALLSGCMINMPDSITGNGHVVKQNRSVSEFSSIKVGSGIDVFLTQGNDFKLDVESDDNLQNWIRTEVNGNELHIFTEKSIRFAKTKKVYVTCKTLERIEISSAGDVTGVTPFKTEKLAIEMSSSGELKFDVEADEIEISISSAGNAYLKGKTNVLKADLSSAGDLNAFDLVAKTGEVSVSSAGDARVYITDEASFESSSAGDIDYRGEPKIRNIRTSSAGSVNKK